MSTSKTNPAQAQTKAPAAASAKAAKPASEAAPAAARSQNAQATTDAADAEGAEAEFAESGTFGGWARELVWQAPSWLVSLLFHLVLMVILALIVITPPDTSSVAELTLSPGEEEDDIESLEDVLAQDELEETIEMSDEMLEVETDVVAEEVSVSEMDAVEPAEMKVKLQDFGVPTAPRSDMLSQLGAMDGAEFGGRSGANKARMVAAAGGSKGSEAAVARALKWLAEHQLPDGGWSFNHTKCPTCQGQCSHPGDLDEARNGATGLALLPFLGAGQTHQDGKYKKTVGAGLYFLASRMKRDGALNEPGGRMYSHGIAAIALCEAYGMTDDKKLMAPAQAAIDFTCYAQDPVGGGWRYTPKQAGDTSAVGWQLMALKSGHMSYLRVPPAVVQKASAFLDSVQANSGATYGYTTPGSGHGTTAVGLLSRMYLGWKKDNPALERGVNQIDKWGFSHGNMYYNYYATQIARHWEGEVWDRWNSSMRDWLVAKQDKTGHQAGSWWFGGGGDHGFKKGGRLYCTAMATMMLEVYYRHLPIYRKQAAEDDFPVD